MTESPSEYYKKYPYLDPPTWLAVDEIMRAYQANDWLTPIKWLIHEEYAQELSQLTGMYRLYHDENGKLRLLGVPVTTGRFPFPIAAVTGDPHQCRVGDFVIPEALPAMERNRLTYHLWHRIPVKPLEELDPSVTMPPPMRYKRMDFIKITLKVSDLWLREQ